MLPDEWTDEVIPMIGKLFPKAALNRDQLEVWQAQLGRRPAQTVKRAIHRVYTTGRFATPRLAEVIAACTGQTSDVPENTTADEHKASYYESIRRRWLKNPNLDQRQVASMTHAQIECNCRYEWFRKALATYGMASVSTVHYWKQWQDQLAEMGTGERLEGGVHDPVVVERYTAFLESEGTQA